MSRYPDKDAQIVEYLAIGLQVISRYDDGTQMLVFTCQGEAEAERLAQELREHDDPEA